MSRSDAIPAFASLFHLQQQQPAGNEASCIGRSQLTSDKSVNNMRLQNIGMQLRKISSHPFLFDWPVDEETNSYVVNEDLVNASGKMLLLNRLLDALFDRGHKVLLFSQFTTMLDVIVSRRRAQSSIHLLFGVLCCPPGSRPTCADHTGGLGCRVQGLGGVPN